MTEAAPDQADGGRGLRLLGLLGSLALVGIGLMLVSLGVAERERAEPPGTVAVAQEGGGTGTVEVRGTGLTARPLPHIARQGAARRTMGVTLAAAGLGALLARALLGRRSAASARWIGAIAVAFGAYALFRLATGAGAAGAAVAAEAREEVRLWAPLTGLAALLAAARR